jgi:hypothetical protein
VRGEFDPQAVLFTAAIDLEGRIRADHPPRPSMSKPVSSASGVRLRIDSNRLSDVTRRWVADAGRHIS